MYLVEATDSPCIVVWDRIYFLDMQNKVILPSDEGYFFGFVLFCFFLFVLNSFEHLGLKNRCIMFQQFCIYPGEEIIGPTFLTGKCVYHLAYNLHFIHFFSVKETTLLSPYATVVFF